MPVPTPQEQVEFLQNMQRLLTDGLFVASYKFALLRALADLAVTKGDDTGDPLTLTAEEIATVFVELYWRQTRPFRSPSNPDGLVLKQNTSKQAAILRAIGDAQHEHNGSMSRCRRSEKQWQRLVRDVAGVVAVMPLWKLQRVGEEVLDFLYPNIGTGRSITLRPGVAYCLRSFYGLIRNLIEGAWLGYVRALNTEVLGQTVDLGSFLFGSERANLDLFRPVLRDIQKDKCFYCRTPLRDKGEVDHFIPWSRYPVDLGHNFVLAHRACNLQKRDHLAAEEHLEEWAERLGRHGNMLTQNFGDLHVSHDVAQSVSITRWAYTQTEKTHGLVWVRKNTMKPLGHTWAEALNHSPLSLIRIG